jgi:hypothetical protein
MFPRDMVCLTNRNVDNLHKGDTENNNNNNNNNNNKTFDRFTTKDSYTWNITKKKESPAVRNLKPKRRA